MARLPATFLLLGGLEALSATFLLLRALGFLRLGHRLHSYYTHTVVDMIAMCTPIPNDFNLTNIYWLG